MGLAPSVLADARWTLRRADERRDRGGREERGRGGCRATAQAGAPTMEQAQQAMNRADEAMQKAREATATAFGGKAQDVEPITTETTVNVAAQRLARDLQAIPGIERFGALRLEELERAGPRPLRTMWRIARDQLGERYGEKTIGEVLEEYGPGSGSTGTHA